MNFQADSQRLLIQILATWVLFSVFALSALAFVLTMFGWMKPDPGTRKFLYGVFSVSAVGIFIGLVGDFLRASPATVANDIGRNGQAEITKQIAEKTTDKPSIVLYTQIASDGSTSQFNALKNTLQGSRYLVPNYEKVDFGIPVNEVKYCNPVNAPDASALADLLKSKGFASFKVIKIDKCNPQKNKNILEVWLQSP